MQPKKQINKLIKKELCKKKKGNNQQSKKATYDTVGNIVSCLSDKAFISRIQKEHL